MVTGQSIRSSLYYRLVLDLAHSGSTTVTVTSSATNFLAISYDEYSVSSGTIALDNANGSQGIRQSPSAQEMLRSQGPTCFM